MWRYSGKSRLIVEFFTTMIITAIIHSLLLDVLDKDLDITNRIEKIVVLENAYSTVDPLVKDVKYTEIQDYYKES